MDQRHLQRTKIVQNLFAHSFKSVSALPFPDEKKTQKIIKVLKKIDQLIEKFAPRYPLQNISRTDLSILRVSVYDLLIDKKTPQKVVINEAVELAKELSGETSYAFVNAVLGKILSETELGNPQGS